jgi:hypothetical protein
MKETNFQKTAMKLIRVPVTAILMILLSHLYIQPLSKLTPKSSHLSAIRHYTFPGKEPFKPYFCIILETFLEHSVMSLYIVAAAIDFHVKSKYGPTPTEEHLLAVDGKPLGQCVFEVLWARSSRAVVRFPSANCTNSILPFDGPSVRISQGAS